MNYTRKEYCNTIFLIADELKLPGYKTMVGMIGYTLPEITKNLNSSILMCFKWNCETTSPVYE
jgi:hypothetical protein